MVIMKGGKYHYKRRTQGYCSASIMFSEFISYYGAVNLVVVIDGNLAQNCYIPILNAGEKLLNKNA